MMSEYSWNMMNPFNWIWSLVAFVIQIAVIIFIILILVRIWKRYQKNGKINFKNLGSSLNTSHAQEILDDKFARAEISEVEYLKRKRALNLKASEISNSDIKNAEKDEEKNVRSTRSNRNSNKNKPS
ncbi:hypothetical protein ATX59_00595 [Oenococcus oeni]|uniref:SHOCT domain-containing protein n=1 Tax=Oenococcus oeni TaxID=1247 RepID=A0A6N4A9E2_OENOE|nr:hypothetical protein [Oenococcus oeni]OIM22160.1 hypothetical protein ATX59_00595 [Oenococcus oeni]